MRTAFFEHFGRPDQDETSIISASGNGHRNLQFEGDRCKPNVIDVAENIPLLSTFVQLLDAAGLEDIFLCAGEY
jgi:NDP-sugar pyrophosphorylase family protein